MVDQKMPALALWGLGLTQIIGYGTLYYAFSILVPDMARDLGWSQQWIFGALSASLVAGGLIAPLSGRWADRHGAARMMAIGSVGASASLVVTALSPGPVAFCVALVLMQILSGFVFYSTAFVTIVQLGGQTAQKSIVHLTLIAGFASTIFWPVTSMLHVHLNWRQVYLIYAALNIGICLPVHAWIAKLAPRGLADSAPAAAAEPVASQSRRQRPEGRSIFILMLVGFSVEGFALSAILVHMVPLTQALGLEAFGLYVASIFGPAQVASRFVNLLFGGSLSQAWLAVLSALFLPLGLLVLLLSSPWAPGAVLFAVLTGLGSGLTSIVSGTLPLELFGREGYGARLGWCSAARQFSAALAPVAFSASAAGLGVAASLWLIAAIGLAGMVGFLAIPFLRDKTAI